jgi:Mg2+ and Co2+ transporter CorA
MSAENLEARIKQLEHSNHELKEIVRTLVDSQSAVEQQLKSIHEIDRETTSLIFCLKDGINVVPRFLASHHMFGDEQSRQMLRDIVSRSEMQFDGLTRHLNDHIKTFEDKFEPPPSPDDQPGK